MVVETSTFEARCYAVGWGEDPKEVREDVRNNHPGLLVQAVSIRSAANESFVELVAAQTAHATVTHNLLTKRPEIDLLLRLAGSTQISLAIKKTGAVKGEPFLLVVAGDGRSVSGFDTPVGWRRLRRRKLDRKELHRIETAALLNALRG